MTMPGQSAHTQPAGLHQPGRRPTWTRVARYPVLALTVLVLGYLIFQVFTANVHSGSRIQQAGGTRVTLTARTVDAARPTAQVLTQAQQVIRARANRIGIPDIQVAVNGDNIVVTVPSDRAGDIDALVQTARLDLRPVISSVPEQPAPSVAPGAPPAPAGGATPPSQPNRRCRPTRARTSPSASPRRRSGGRATAPTSRWLLYSFRPPGAAAPTCWPATTTRSCHSSPAPPTPRPRTCSGRRSSTVRASRRRRCPGWQRLPRQPAVQLQGDGRVGRLHGRSRRHPDRIHIGYPSAQRSGAQRGDTRRSYAVERR